MVFELDKSSALSDQDTKREKRIIQRLNLKELPFSITADNFCARYLEMFKDLKPLLDQFG